MDLKRIHLLVSQRIQQPKARDRVARWTKCSMTCSKLPNLYDPYGQWVYITPHEYECTRPPLYATETKFRDSPRRPTTIGVPPLRNLVLHELTPLQRLLTVAPLLLHHNQPIPTLLALQIHYITVGLKTRQHFVTPDNNNHEEELQGAK